MDYYINPTSFSAVFTIPTSVVDRYLKLAKPEHIKVIIYILRNMSNELSEKEISENTGVKEYDVKEALLYWADAGILLPKEENPPKKKAEKSEKSVLRSLKPERGDVAKRGLEDPKIRYMLREAQIKMGRNLKTNETSTLVWLYEDQGLDVSLILLIIQYAVKRGHCNIRFIESTAIDWVNRGIDSIALADDELARMAESDQAWNIVRSAFGIERRMPSKKERELSSLWICDWKISTELLKSAYDACVDAKSKFSFAYTAKIIESWHQKGYTSPDEIQRHSSDDNNSGSSASYDIDMFEKILNSEK